MEIRPILSALMRNKIGPVLVALQVALSLAILANALHIVDERRSAAARPSGLVDEAATFAMTVGSLADETPELRLANIHQQLQVLRAVPGVVSVAQVQQMPLSQSGDIDNIMIDRNQERETCYATTYISADSLVNTFGLQLVEGRDFLPSEIAEVNQISQTYTPPYAIITSALAEKLWPGQSAIGKTLFYGSGSQAPEARVVGVVERLASPGAELGERGEFSIQVPARQYGRDVTMFAVRSEPGQRDRVMQDAQQALTKASATPLAIDIETTEDHRKGRYQQDVALSWMLVAVSVMLLLITASGIVGMASLWVTQRRRQIGVRRALGARKLDILRYFIVENLLITSSGVVGGVLLGIGLNQLLVTKLGMAHLPLGYLVAGALGFWLLGIVAAYGPAWRAASISPALATRST